MGSEIRGARGHDHSAEADRQSADRLRAAADAARRETEPAARRHLEREQEREAASRLPLMFSPIGGIPLGKTRPAAIPEPSGQDGAGQGSNGREDPGGRRIVHGFAEFRGNRYDEWSDGTRTVTRYGPADGALPVDHAADVRSRVGHRQDGPKPSPDTVYVDGREMAVSYDPGEGVWFGGMGEIPDAPKADPNGTGHAGYAFAGTFEKSRSEHIGSELFERFDNISDSGENISDEFGRLLDPPPTSAYVGARPDSSLSPAHPEGIDIPDATKAVLALVAFIWGIAHEAHKGYNKVAEWMRGRMAHARDR